MVPTLTPDRPVRVLLIDDDRDDYLLTRDLFTEVPGGRFVVDWVSGYEAGLEAMCRSEHDIYLVDYLLDARTGLELLQEARRRGCPGPVILLTGKGMWEVDHAAMKAGAADYLEKGRLDSTLLDRSVRYALWQSRYEAELERQVRERTDELARANEALREADRRKTAFLGTLGHELRNPMAPIRNALEIMKLAGARPEMVAQAREILERQVRHLARLVDELLDVSRVTRGTLRLADEAFDLTAAVDEAVAQGRPAVEKAGLELRVERPEGAVPLRGDRGRLAQVIGGLLDNAAKYTPAGGRVTVSAAREGGEAVVRVRDTGAGLPPEALPRIFEMFTQVDRELDRTPEGLGNSLAVAAHIVRRHGGKLEAHSGGAGRGTEMVVRLPVASAAGARA